MGQGDRAGAGSHGASTASDRDQGKVQPRCLLWGLLYNPAESEVTLPALPTFTLEEGGGAQTRPGLPNHPRLARHDQPTPHRVHGAVRPRQVQVHQGVGLGQEAVEGLGREGGGVAGEGVTETRPCGLSVRRQGRGLCSMDSRWTHPWRAAPGSCSGPGTEGSWQRPGWPRRSGPAPGALSTAGTGLGWPPFPQRFPAPKVWLLPFPGSLGGCVSVWRGLWMGLNWAALGRLKVKCQGSQRKYLEGKWQSWPGTVW